MKLQLEDVKSDSAMNIISLALGGDVSKMEKTASEYYGNRNKGKAVLGI